MKILICGASGFVGRHLTKALREADHTVIRAVRRPSEPDDISVDFCNDTSKDIWLPRLHGINIVINTVGVLRDNPETPMQKLHTDTPIALFTACVEAGVERIVQLSALGVDSGIDVPYFTTRLVTERALHELPAKVLTLCLRPSVIYGEDGASAQMFRKMAKVPVQILPMGGIQSLQPVHIDDVCEAVTHWLAEPNAASQIIDAVGAEATTMRGMLDSYREQLHRSAAWHVALPAIFARLAARMGDFIPSSPLCSDTYKMLAVGNTGPSSRFAVLLGHQPRSYREFIS